MCKKTSLLQRGNMSIDKKRNLLALQRSAMSEALENDATNLVSKTLHTRLLPVLLYFNVSLKKVT